MVSDQFIVLSDLHVGPGGAGRGAEAFHRDEWFVDFLRHLRQRAEAEGSRWTLLLLGDFLDFDRVEVEPAEDGDAEAAAKLEYMIAGHPRLFEALAEFLGCGFDIELVAGNHDIDLVRPLVQRRLSEAVTGSADGALGRGRVRVHPWLYYVPGVLYAEHGHQYHDINSFTRQLRPYVDAGRKRTERSLAAAMGDYLGDLAAVAGANRDARSISGRAVLGAFCRRPALVVTTAGRHLEFVGVLASHQAGILSPHQAARRRDYRRRVLADHAPETGLDHRVLVDLDRLSEQIRRSMPGRLSRKVLSGGVGTANVDANDYLWKSAARVHDALASAGNGVPFYVFGHTHVAARRPLTNRGRATYLNAGTWSSLVRGCRGASSDRRPAPFVEITPGPDGPTARICAWSGKREIEVEHGVGDPGRLAPG